MLIQKLKTFLGSLAHMHNRTQVIRRINDGFTIDGKGELPLRLSEIVAVNGTRVDKVTYEENYLIFVKADGEKAAVGELADGFAEFEGAVYTSLNGFPQEWRAMVESAAENNSVILWSAKHSP